MRKSPPLVAALLALLFCVPSAASVPIHLPVQGTLADNAGQPVADAAFMMTFSLYASADAEEAVWTETWPPGEPDCVAAPEGCVAVAGGVFSVQLGAHEPLAAQVFAGGGLWLGIAVEGEPELPRAPVGAAPFAWHAAHADELACTGCVSIDALSEAARATLAADAVAAVEANAGPLLGSQLPADGLDEVSNGVLTNTFMATFESPAAPVEVTDLWPPGVSDAITLPPMGALMAVWVSVELDHQAPEETQISLAAPNGEVFVLHDHTRGAGAGSRRPGALTTPCRTGAASQA